MNEADPLAVGGVLPGALWLGRAQLLGYGISNSTLRPTTLVSDPNNGIVSREMSQLGTHNDVTSLNSQRLKTLLHRFSLDFLHPSESEHMILSAPSDLCYCPLSAS
jgi:hypothetical protein